MQSHLRIGRSLALLLAAAFTFSGGAVGAGR